MKRVLSIWLPYWPADRFRRARARHEPGLSKPSERAPLAFTVNAQSTQRLAAVDQAAAALGLFPGMRLGDARALLPALSVEPYAPGDDTRELWALALWCGRFSPWVTPEKPPADKTPANKTAAKEALPDPLYQGLRLDISGCAHLFGGEAALAADLLRRLQGFGFQAQAAIADGIGAAWALARFDPRAAAGPVIMPMNEGDATTLRDTLAPLSVQALRLPDDVIQGLERLGLRCLGTLYEIPAKGLTARFGTGVARRLAQALGRQDEPLSPEQPGQRFWTRLDFGEPIGHGDDIAAAADRLVAELCAILHRAGMGALKLCLRFFLADGTVQEIHLGCARASRDAAHLRRLLREHLPVLEAAFGADAMTLQANRVERLAATQIALDPRAPHNDPGAEGFASDFADADLGLLVDRLGNRLGLTNLARFRPRDSHIPEQAVRLIGPLEPARPVRDCFRGWPQGTATPRPLLMLAAPEPIETVAEIPDGPPAMFRWRGKLHRLVKVDGPERIAPEWWRAKTADQALDGAGHATVTRDYFRVEDQDGARFWLYRRGLYEQAGGRTGGPRWYLQGIFP